MVLILTVDDNMTNNGTSISTYTFYGEINQQLKFCYLGMGLSEKSTFLHQIFE